MLIISVQCPSCHTSFPVDPRKVPVGGVKVRCSVCSGIFFVEKPEAPAVVPVPPTEAVPTPPAAEPVPPVAESTPVAEPVPPLAESTPVADPVPPVAESTPAVGESAPERPEHDTGPEGGRESVARDGEWGEDEDGADAERVEDEDAADVTAAAEPVQDDLAGRVDPWSGGEWNDDVEMAPDPWSGGVGLFIDDGEDLDHDSAPSPAEPPPAAEEWPAMEAPAEAPPAAEEWPAVEAPAEPPPAAEEWPAVVETPPPAAAPEPVLDVPSVDSIPSPPPGGFQFGKRDPHDKAKRLARVLVSDIITYNPDRHQVALERESLHADFEEEIRKSWVEYVDQVGNEIAESTPYWFDALNEILARGRKVF